MEFQELLAKEGEGSMYIKDNCCPQQQGRHTYNISLSCQKKEKKWIQWKFYVQILPHCCVTEKNFGIKQSSIV